MEFTLTYRGPLKGDGNPAEKQAVREYIHPQLQELWKHPPLDTKQHMLTTQAARDAEGVALVQSFGGFNFLPLVSERFGLAAELQITFLRNGAPGMLIKQGGDLDNRLKTLLDALSMPDKNQIAGASPSVQPPSNFFCLLENDILIYSITVNADRLLNASAIHAKMHPHVATHPSLEVLLLIKVITRTTRMMIMNMDM